MARPTMLASASGELKTRARAELALEVGRDLEDAALALDLVEVLLARHVGHVLAEDDDARVALHLLVQAAVDEIDHRAGVPRKLRALLVVELFRGRVNVGRVDVLRGRVGRGLRARERGVGRLADLAVNLVLELLQLVLRDEALFDEQRAEALDGVALGVRRALLVRPVELLVVRERVRVGADDLRVDERRAFALAAVLDGALQSLQRLDRVGAVAAFDKQVGEAFDQAGHVAARGLHLDGDADGVAVVFDEEDDGQLQVARRVQGLPELALARRAVAGRAVDDLVALEADDVLP